MKASLKIVTPQLLPNEDEGFAKGGKRSRVVFFHSHVRCAFFLSFLHLFPVGHYRMFVEQSFDPI